jgi:hypothetical protein
MTVRSAGDVQLSLRGMSRLGRYYAAGLLGEEQRRKEHPNRPIAVMVNLEDPHPATAKRERVSSVKACASAGVYRFRTAKARAAATSSVLTGSSFFFT